MNDPTIRRCGRTNLDRGEMGRRYHANNGEVTLSLLEMIASGAKRIIR
jgi:hypothetical protein